MTFHIVWTLNTIRTSAIELSAIEFATYLHHNHPSSTFTILSFDDKKYPTSKYVLQQFENNGIQTYVINYKTFFLLPHPATIVEYIKALKFLNPSIVHVYQERFSFIACLLSHFLRIKTFRTVCHIFSFSASSFPVRFLRRLSKTLQRLILRFLSIQFFTCSTTNAENERTFFFNSGAYPIFNWFSPRTYNTRLRQKFSSTLTPSDTTLRIATIGGNWPYKNYSSILYALSHLKRFYPDTYKNLHYVQVGPCNTSLIELANELSIQDSITFYGEVSDWRPYVADAAFLLAPSHEEGLCQSVVEASAFGLVPILSTNKCLNEHTRLVTPIWLVDTSPLSIAHALINVSQLSKELISSLSSLTAQKALQHYGSDSVIPLLFSFYNQ